MRLVHCSPFPERLSYFQQKSLDFEPSKVQMHINAMGGGLPSDLSFFWHRFLEDIDKVDGFCLESGAESTGLVSNGKYSITIERLAYSRSPSLDRQDPRKVATRLSCDQCCM
jgi:hypothetical protein